MPRQSLLARRTRERFESQIRVLNRQLDELRQELRDALKATIAMTSADVDFLLRGFRYPKSREELNDWQWRIADAVLDVVEPKPAHEFGEYCSTTERTFCPLCRGSRVEWIGPRDRGFAYPDGLKRHLVGSYNSQRCRVVDAALRLAELNLVDASANFTAETSPAMGGEEA